MTNIDEEKTAKLNILMLPSFEENPYQTMLGQELKLKGVGVNYWSYSHGKLPIFKAAIAQKKKTGLDLIHLHWIHTYLEGEDTINYSWLCFKFLLDIIITRLYGIKIVWTVHNQLSHNAQFPKLELWTRQILAKLVNRLIFMSKSSLESTVHKYKFSSKKAAIIPHGNYRKSYGPLVDKLAARQELNLPLTGEIYLNLGLLKPYKGVEKLLETWQENRNIFKDDILLIAGKPYEEAYGEELIKMASEIEGVILYPEFVEDSKINLYFSAADVAVFPFKKILNSGSLVLAMSYGKPIIAPRLGGIAEVLEEADSLLYDPEDELGLINAWKKSTQVDLDELSKVVVEVCDRLDWDKIAEKTLDVYLSVLK